MVKMIFGMMLLVIASITSPANAQVFINGQQLSSQQIQELERLYQTQTVPGRYWYDNKSGMYGLEGQGTSGFLYAGHNFGRIHPKASNGNTGVFFNGRELPYSEYLVFSQLQGYYIAQGRYWMDSQGNAGVEGNQIAAVNFFTLANQYQQQNNQNTNNGGYYYSSGQGNNGGGNAWGSRWSSGNSDGNTHVIYSDFYGVLDHNP